MRGAHKHVSNVDVTDVSAFGFGFYTFLLTLTVSCPLSLIISSQLCFCSKTSAKHC